MMESVKLQRELLLQNNQSNIVRRKENLRKLYSCIYDNMDAFSEALYKDLGKSSFEAYTTEIGFVLSEISDMIRHISSWAKPKKVRTNQLINFWSVSKIFTEPFGQVLIISPWNYPLNLSLAPVAAVLAAGNLICLKPSEYSPNTSNLLKDLIPQYFPDNTIQVFTGDAKVSQALLVEKWDFIFFTGSPAIGKIVYQSAAENLTPVCLELGGKSPVYVDESANIPLAAKRIAYGKLLNAGQTCIAPDYVYVSETVYDDFLKQLELQIHAFWGDNPVEHPDYPQIVNEMNLNRLIKLIDGVKTKCIGTSVEANRKLNPHIILNPEESERIMQEEIFGPLLPVISVSNPEEAISRILTRPKPLALYLFLRNRTLQKQFISSISSGGVCINDTIMHITNPRLPFGGVGNSGIGVYHGKSGFDTFSHHKSILKKANWIDPKLRYPPFKSVKLKLAKWVLK
jgi:aldehyde dehydrogenase (NAD+)